MTDKIAYKAFNKDLTCRDFQYEIGKTYTHEGAPVRCTNQGFHACENPFDVLNYYNLCGSRFAEVTYSGDTDRNKDGDTKFATAEITIKAEISLPQFVKAAVTYLIDRVKTDDDAQLASSGYSAKLASSGDYAQLASSGDYAKLASSGDYAQLASSGDYAQLASSGDYSVVTCSGRSGLAKGSDGTWISLAEFSGDKCIGFATGCIGQDGLKPDTWYRAKGGKLVEAA